MAFQFPTLIERRYIFFRALLRSGVAGMTLSHGCREIHDA